MRGEMYINILMQSVTVPWAKKKCLVLVRQSIILHNEL